MYLLRPYMLLGARVCEEPVHTPWCSNSTLGRFSSRQRVTLVPHVVVASATFLRRFVEEPPTTVDFLVPKQGTSLSSIAAPRKRIDILER